MVPAAPDLLHTPSLRPVEWVFVAGRDRWGGERVVAGMLPGINIGADVWGESSNHDRQVFLNAGDRLFCTSDGVCVIVYV